MGYWSCGLIYMLVNEKDMVLKVEYNQERYILLVSEIRRSIERKKTSKIY